MEFAESQSIELKLEYTEEIKRTVIAFVNGEGGVIYIGVADSGEVAGVQDADEVCQKITSSCRNSIKPDITMFLKVNIVEIDGKNIVKVEVGRGTDAPYYLAEKGMKPAGVFIRVGTSTVQASEVHIRNMIKLTDKGSFIELRSIEQSLTFDIAEKVFADAGIAFGEAQKVTLGLVDTDGQYTNLGLLLSDQCEHTIKLAVFEGTTKAVFRDRKEFSGSLFKQLADVTEYINLVNKVHATFKGLQRIDSYDYPPVAIREALLNAVVHRDYSLSGSTFINIYDDKIEFLSLGGLVYGLNIQAIKQGYSMSRNAKLANIFYKLRLVEAYGTGIPRIMEIYKNYVIKPQIDVTDNSFRICFPNSNYGRNNEEIKIKAVSPDIEKAVIEFIAKSGAATRKEIAESLSLKSTNAYNILKVLVDQGKIAAKKRGKTIVYLTGNKAE